jgi:glycosyltransferase involved in cell wall biosynthesis
MKILGMSDPLSSPTGFGRVARELFIRLGTMYEDKFQLGYLSRGWVGTRKFPNVQTYSSSLTDAVNSGAFPIAAQDFEPPFILWTLTDPWQTGWISHMESNTYSTQASAEWLKANREKMLWIGHYPVDGEGINGPPFWYDAFMNGPDVTVFMSEYGHTLMKDHLSTQTRFISHAVDTNLFHPVAPEAREAAKANAGLGGRFVVISVMANRYRKYWPELLYGFKMALRKNPDLHLLAICGDPMGNAEDTWSLVEIAKTLGLMEKGKERVTFISSVPEHVLARMYMLSDMAALVSAGEGFGLPQLEAHACGLPCVVGRYSASEELIVSAGEGLSPAGWTYHGNNVIKRPVYSPADIADRILFWSRSSARMGEVARLGLEQALERSWEKVLPQWVALFEEQWAVLMSKHKEPEPVAGPA